MSVFLSVKNTAFSAVLRFACALFLAAGEVPSAFADEPELAVDVEGSRAHPSESEKEPGVASWTADRRRLDPAGMTVADVLRESPGVQVTELGGLGAPATARLRGATSAQTPVYFGNLRLNDEVGGVADFGFIPSFLLERVEVYRSHAPRTATALGLGGAIILYPRRPSADESLLRGELGSFGSRSLAGYSSFVRGTHQSSFGASVDQATNDYSYLDTRGTLWNSNDDEVRRLTNADTSRRSLWLSHTERLKSGEISVLFAHLAREQGAPKLALLPTRSARTNVERTLAAVTSQLGLGRTTLNLSTSAIFGETDVHDPDRELALLALRSRSPGVRLEQILGGQHRLHRRLLLLDQFSVSLEQLQRIDEAEQGITSIQNARRLSSRAAAGAEVQLSESTSLSALGEMRCLSTSEDTLAACPEVVPGVRGGALTRLGNAQFFANLARATRLPTLSELYGTNPLVRGNPSLVPEHGLVLEAGLRLKVPRRGGNPYFWAEASGFARDTQELITFVKSAQGYLAPVNRRSARTLGAEIVLGAYPLPNVFTEGQLSLLDPRDTSADRATENNLLPFLSPLTTSFVVRPSFTLGTTGAPRLGLGLRVHHQSSRYADPAGLAVIPSQTSVDAEAELHLFEESVSLRGRIANLFDARRFDVVGFPLPGRSVFVNLELLWK